MLVYPEGTILRDCGAEYNHVRGCDDAFEGKRDERLSRSACASCPFGDVGFDDAKTTRKELILPIKLLLI